MRTLTIDEYTIEYEPMKFLDVQEESKKLRRLSNKVELLENLSKRLNRDLVDGSGDIDELTTKIEELDDQRDMAEDNILKKMIGTAKAGITSIKKGEEVCDISVVDSFGAEDLGKVNAAIMGEVTKKN